MTCDEVELQLVCGDALSADAEAHLGTCEKCRAFARDAKAVVEAAAPPELTAADRAALSSLAPSLHLQWKRAQRRRGTFRGVLGLATAACIGAAVASAALVPRLSGAPDSVIAESTEWPSELSAPSESDDEIDFEVSWPSFAVNEEGETR